MEKLDKINVVLGALLEDFFRTADMFPNPESRTSALSCHMVSLILQSLSLVDEVTDIRKELEVLKASHQG